MFSIATTNMILRGDGQSNLICEDFLAQDPGELQLSGGGITVGFMNPPHIIKCFLLKIQGFSTFHISVNKPQL